MAKTNGNTRKEKDIVERAARMMEEIKESQAELKSFLSEASEELQIGKASLRQAAKEMNMDDGERAQIAAREQELDQLRSTLGILADLPLGQAATGEGVALQ